MAHLLSGGSPLRRLVKTGAAAALHWTQAARLTGPRWVVLGYHRVVDRFPVPGERLIRPMAVSRDTFVRHLEWLGKRFAFVSLDELGQIVAQGRTPAKPVVALTFDDGYQDNYLNAFPILRRKGIPAAVFVVTGLIGTSGAQIHDRFYSLLDQFYEEEPDPCRYLEALIVRAGLGREADGRLRGASTPFDALRRFLEALPQGHVLRIIELLEEKMGRRDEAVRSALPLTWEMVLEMQASGITIGAHTMTHPCLPNESAEKVWAEVDGSKRELERRLGRPVRHFAYPSGRFDRTSVQALAASGYTFGYTTCRHCDLDYPLLTLPRKLLWEGSCADVFGPFSGAVMSSQVHGLFDGFNPCRQKHSGIRSGAWKRRTQPEAA